MNDKLLEKLLTGKFNDFVPVKIIAVTLSIFAVIFAVAILKWPTKTDIVQWGFRGTAMQVVYNEKLYSEALKVLDTIPLEDEPVEVTEDSVLAKDVYENVQVLGHLSEDNFLRLMTSITEWVAPEQGCAYCHGDSGEFVSDDLYTKVVSRRMIEMTLALNSEWSTHTAPAGVTCFTCHRGQNVPQYIWFDQEPAPGGVVGWQNNQNSPNPRVASATLPNNVFEEFLVKDRGIRVVHPDSRMSPTPVGTKDAEWSYGLMVHMSKSLNVGCVYCHNTRAINVWEESPPQRTTAWYGIRMVRDINNTYLNPLQPVYPDFRLGPTGDAPKANCQTCHQGVFKPLFGQPVLENWPELVPPAEAAPVADAAPEQQAMAD